MVVWLVIKYALPVLEAWIFYYYCILTRMLCVSVSALLENTE